MGCLTTKDPMLEDQKIRNRQLEKKLKIWNRDYKKAIKLLLLGMANHHLCLCITINNNKLTFYVNVSSLFTGTGESGKTTIIKQMRILHINGFSERYDVTMLSHQSVSSCMLHCSMCFTFHFTML